MFNEEDEEELQSEDENGESESSEEEFDLPEQVDFKAEPQKWLKTIVP